MLATLFSEYCMQIRENQDKPFSVGELNNLKLFVPWLKELLVI